MTDLPTVDYKCAQCGAQGVQFHGRVFVHHDPACSLWGFMQQAWPELTVHLQRGDEDSYTSTPWDGT